MTPDLEKLLSDHGIRPTANRLMIASALAGAGRPLSMTELETILETIDKSGIFRALTVFREKRLVHTIENSEGIRYEICHSGCADHDEDIHAHFYCTRCGRTLCLEKIPVPDIDLPQGFKKSSVNLVVTGICPQCSHEK
ncbi:MAG: Fur family transcriptional regulator [Candidatus Cryptobacteroides sp.]